MARLRLSPASLVGLSLAVGLFAGSWFQPAAACGSKFQAGIDCCECVYSILNKECEVPECNICINSPCRFPGAHMSAGTTTSGGLLRAARCEITEPAQMQARERLTVVVATLKART